MNSKTERIGYRVASALLFHYGEIPIDTIKALPFFKNANESECVIQSLLNNINTEIYNKKISSEPISEWEKIIKIREKM